jgi:hypothetical protein
VVTTGACECDYYDDLQRRRESSRCYTRSFNGTSSAAAIVAGCVAAIEGVLKAHGLGPLPLCEMKKLLVDTGTYTDHVANGGIGPLPNLQKAIETLERCLKDKYPSFPGFVRV